MALVQRWTGRETKALRLAMRQTIRGFADYLGVEPRTVAKWEQRGATITLLPESQGRLDTALARVQDDVRHRFQASLQPEPVEEEDDTKRRDVTKLLGLTLATAVSQPALDVLERLAAPSAPPRVDPAFVNGHRDVAYAFASLYRSADPRSALPVLVNYADELLPLLDAPMDDHLRTDLAAIVTGVHAQIGLWACHLHRPALAYRYLSAACHISEGVSDQPLQARALGAFSYYFSSAPRGGHGGDPQRSLALLNKATALAQRADSFTTGWLATWRADQHATLGQISAAQRDLDRADAGLDADDDDTGVGFFARSTYGYGMREHRDSVRAFTLALAGDDATSHTMFEHVDSRAANMRRRIATAGHRALAHAKVGEPDRACAEVARAVELGVDHHYAMGVERALGVRAGFDPSWSIVPCVRDLDERLRQLTS
ncbi:helix-turn-helix domain-containing protein [Haloechinothrix halophila]|uniref:helix-turn-helix domain-containing protein n=1 Tax=Haloechinothrix halophila TaxID=1069073 RepID=UPI000556F2A3|nr:hypothetical protein [Haloechinothrix halophila]